MLPFLVLKTFFEKVVCTKGVCTLFFQKKILITGGTGSWAEALIVQLLEKKPRKIIIVSRNEAKQVEMKRKFHSDPRMIFLLGDVRDKEAMVRAARGCDILFHLAALKHVPVCESEPFEAVKTNICGTQNVIDAALKNKVERVIYLSTDKAANPANFYGLTKACGEKLILDADKKGETTNFLCFRGGNLLLSNGNVVEIFLERLKKGEPLQLTDRRMTRFFQTRSEAARSVLLAAQMGKGGEIWIPKMKAARMIDIARVMCDLFGTAMKVEEIGCRPGEKLHEVLISEHEREHLRPVDDNFWKIVPYKGGGQQNETAASFSGLCSDDSLMSPEEMKRLLAKEGVSLC